MTRAPRFPHVLRAAAALCLLLHVLSVSAQEVTAPALKAAFIYNFAKFTTWPDDVLPDGAPLVMCVLGDLAVADALDRATRSRLVSGHRVEISRVTAAATREGCHLLYVSGMSPGRAAQLAAAVADTPILTVSDVAGFTASGGIAQLYFQQGQLRFDVDQQASRRAQLQISSRLLALARRP